MVLYRLLQILTGVLLGLAFVAVLFLFRPPGDRPPGTPAMGPTEPEPYPAPELALRDVEGRRVALSDFRGEVVLVFFGFANCPDVCPMTLHRWSRALEALEGSERTFQGLFVSVDPDRDTPETLSRWMERFHPSLVALTGSADEIAHTVARWGVHVRVVPPGADAHAGHGPSAEGETRDEGQGAGGGDYMVEHSTRTFVVDGEGRVVRTLPANLETDEILELLAPVLNP